MHDIVAGIAIMAVATLMLGTAGLWIGRHHSRRRTTLLLALTVGFMLIFARSLLDSGWMLRLLPFSNAIVLANWQLPATGLVTGLAWHLLPRPVWRRCLVILPLAALGIWRFYGPLGGDKPNIRNRWSGDVCLQSSFSSCTPAAAATLLRAAGIEASEAEMSELCLTRNRGTTFHGLYRGLKLKTVGTPWRVEVVPADLRILRSLDGPVLLNVGLPRNPTGIDPRYQQNWGWTPGTSHSVVLLGRLPAGKIEMADPAYGREEWNDSALDTLWRGQALRLVER